MKTTIYGIAVICSEHGHGDSLDFEAITRTGGYYTGLFSPFYTTPEAAQHWIDRQQYGAGRYRIVTCELNPDEGSGRLTRLVINAP